MLLLQNINHFLPHASSHKILLSWQRRSCRCFSKCLIQLCAPLKRPCKGKRQHLLTLQVRRNCFLSLQSSVSYVLLNNICYILSANYLILSIFIFLYNFFNLVNVSEDSMFPGKAFHIITPVYEKDLWCVLKVFICWRSEWLIWVLFNISKHSLSICRCTTINCFIA